MTRASQVTKRCCMTSMGEPMNEYEAKRAQRMAANRAALLALQIDSLGPKRPARAPARRPVIPGAPLRRSSRLNIKRSAEPEAGHNQLVMLADRRKKESKRIRLAKDVTLALPLADAGRAPAARSRVPSSQLSTDLEWFHTRWLGHQLQPRGKRPVMQGMSPEGFVPTFSQMSGLQQWKNALVLFVNVDGSAGYANTFHETAVAGDRTAVSFRWFAQRRWTTESPAVRRLCNTKRGHRRLQFDATFDAPLDPTASQDDPLLLFLRNEQVYSLFLRLIWCWTDDE